jgi:hypothetical protein
VALAARVRDDTRWAESSGVVALAGRRVDPDDSAEARFPLDRCPAVAAELATLLDQASATRLICSAAAGADLLALDVASRLGISKHVVLPYDPEVFRNTSVTDRPGDWASIFDRVLRDLAPKDRLEILEERRTSANAFRAVNQTIVDHALQAASAGGDILFKAPLAIVVWEGQPRGADDATDDFRVRAAAAGLGLVEILTLARMGS